MKKTKTTKSTSDPRPPRPFLFERIISFLGILVPIAVAIIVSRKKE